MNKSESKTNWYSTVHSSEAGAVSACLLVGVKVDRLLIKVVWSVEDTTPQGKPGTLLGCEEGGSRSAKVGA